MRRPNDPVTDAIAEVRAVEQAWVDAHLHSDVATLTRLMAPDYAKIEADGAVRGRAEVLATFEPGNRMWEVAAGDAYDIRVYGDTAVVIGRWTARGVNHGNHFDYQARFLTVYVRRGGDWQIVAEQSTEIPK